MGLVSKTRQFLADNEIDYLLVNATNEFLVEYAELGENSRYFLTGFSGSTGDALLSKDNLSLFVDGRYHEQADSEVDPKVVSVVKLRLGQSFFEPLKKKIKKGKTLGLVAQKNTQGRLEILQSLLKDKNVKIVLLDSDPVMELADQQKPVKKSAIEQVDLSIAGVSEEEKLKQVQSRLKTGEALFVTNLEEVSYLTNLRDFSTNYSSKIKAKCLVTKKMAVLFTDEKLDFALAGFQTEKMDGLKQNVESLAGIKTFFADKSLMNIFDYNILSAKAEVSHKDFVKGMKAVKNDSEIEHMKKCFERADNALFGLREFIEENDNLSEFDIAKKLEEFFYAGGAKSLSFKSIVAKDKNSALAHYSKSSKDEVLKEGSLVLVDCGAYYEGGYATDATRVFVKGEPSNLQKKIYTLVLKAFLTASGKKMTGKITGLALDKAARKVLEELAPRGFCFSHGLGHGIGINVHESPPTLGFSPLAKTVIEPNMCFTIEPGLYKKDFGGVRLENTFYLEKTKNGSELKSFSNMCFEKKLIDFDLLTAADKKRLKTFEVR